MSPHYKLYYFNTLRAHAIRMILAYKAVPFEDIPIEKKDWHKWQSKMIMGEVPVLEVDGKMLGTSLAINRYLGRTFGMAGSNDWESAQCDMMADGVMDVHRSFMRWVLEPDEKKKEEILTEWENETVKPFLELYEKFLKQGGTGHFVGNKMTWADIYIFAMLNSNFVSHLVQPHAELSKFCNMVGNEPKIKHWLETHK